MEEIMEFKVSVGEKPILSKGQSLEIANWIFRTALSEAVAFLCKEIKIQTERKKMAASGSEGQFRSSIQEKLTRLRGH